MSVPSLPALLPRRCRTAVAILILALALPASPALSQQDDDDRVWGANRQLASRFTDARMERLTFDTRVEPHWLEDSEDDRFWYPYETAEGKVFWIVDPVAGTKEPIFDNADMAAQLTRLTRDPYDAKHLPIEKIRWVKDNTAIQFDVVSSQYEEEEEIDGDTQEREEDRERRGEREKKVHHFEYDLQTRQVTELEDYEEPPDHPDWANISPDEQWVVFGRKWDLYMMSYSEYEEWLAKEKEKEEEGEDQEGEDGDDGDQEEDEDAEEPEFTDLDPDIEEIRLTTDGEEHYGYVFWGRGETDDEREESMKERAPVRIVWSHDGSRFALVRRDDRQVADLWVIHNTADPRPKLETYRYAMAGEEKVTQEEIWAFDVESRRHTKLDTERFVDQNVDIFTARQFPRPDAEEPIPDLWLSPSPDELYWGRISRDLHRYDVVRTDLSEIDFAFGPDDPYRELEEAESGTADDEATVADAGEGDDEADGEGGDPSGETSTDAAQADADAAEAPAGPHTVLIEERLNTYVEVQRPELLESGDILWWSERDGWGHYYRYDNEGNLQNRLTEGEFSGRAIEGIDEDAGVIYFTATGREEGDPYYRHLYRVGLDGSGLELLNPGDFDTTVSMSESNRFFVSDYSRVNTVPASELRATDGRVLMELQEADLSLLMEAGYQFPEPFRVKAGDSVTDLYGVMYKPFDFDPERRYPIIAYVYPGPQTEAVSKSFSTRSQNVHLAQLGFIVIEVGNRGGHPWRSKWYHNYGYGNLRDYGLEDKKVAIEQLAARHDFIDLDRVGIFGHSGGGFMSTAAMLVYPDFFDVAVSSSGNHENQVYNRWWSEKHHG
ncbi:MAG: DPP IV N-terminal domain-containing protein, partial [Acidobacteriota bacterium]